MSIFTFGQADRLLDNPSFAEFVGILQEINGDESVVRNASEDRVCYLNPDRDQTKPHLYIDYIDATEQYLKYGIPGDATENGSVNLAVYNEGNIPTLYLENLKHIYEQLVSQSSVVDLNQLEDEAHSDQESATSEHGDQVSIVRIVDDYDVDFLCKAVTAVGGLMLLVGAILASPMLAVVGACVSGFGAVGMGYNGFFNAVETDDEESKARVSLS